MNVHIKKFRKEFHKSYTEFSTKRDDDGIRFGIMKLKKNEMLGFENKNEEHCFVLLNGKVKFSSDDMDDVMTERKSLLNESPSTFLAGPYTGFRIEAMKNDTELACVHVKNSVTFSSKFFKPSQVETEHRGKGKLSGTAYRHVRTIFDKRTMPQSNLVVGEVITLPGRWSSYPPHHHPQPEIYFYRFFPEEGYGFAQVGEDVYKVENNDLIKIPAGKDHPQVAAPGYTMWYLWVIRHLPRNPYIEPEFTKKHKWVFENEKRVWKGKDK